MKGFGKFGRSVVCALAAAVAVFALGCGKADDYAAYREKISEVRDVYYYGESEHFEVEAVAGRREEPFRADGFAEPTEKYFLVLVYPKVNLERRDISVSFEADRVYQAKLLKNPAFDSYAYDFGAVERVPQNFRLELSCEIFIEEVTLLCASSGATVKADRVLAMGVDAFHEREDWEEREREGFEIGIRLVRDREKNGALCWHYMMIFRDGTVWGKIFDAAPEASE